MPLNERDRALLLAEPLIAVLSVSAGPDRGPLTTPIWYSYRKSGEVVVFTGVGSRKARLARAAGRCSLLVQRTEPSYRYVSVEGPVTFGPVDAAIIAEIAGRYVTGAALDNYVRGAMPGIADLTTITLTPRHWTSADIPLS